MVSLRPRVIRVRPNDSRWSISVHVDNLHPSSRLRSILEREVIARRASRYRADVGRNVLISLVASYRHNVLLPKEGLTEEELVLEVERDCVTLCAEPSVCSDQTRALCEHVAASIARWQRMRSAMDRPQYQAMPCATSTRCAIQFIPYLPFGGVDFNHPYRELLLQFLAYLAAALLDSDVVHAVIAAARERQTGCHADVARQLRASMETVLSRESDLFFLTVDAVRSPVFREFAFRMSAYLLDEPGGEYNGAPPVRARRIYRRLPDLARIFLPMADDPTCITPERKLLAECLLAHGFRVVGWLANVDGLAPLPFPFSWKVGSALRAPSASRAPVFVVERTHHEGSVDGSGGEDQGR
jgi:hypothetical protein